MENNDVLRRLRFIIDANDQKMLEIFGNVNFKPSQEEVVSWLKKEDHADYVECSSLISVEKKMMFFRRPKISLIIISS